MVSGTALTDVSSDLQSAADRRQQLTDELMARLHSGDDSLDEDGRADLLNRVVVINTPVAHRIARKFQGRGCPLEDLEQTACLALVRAVRQYDPSTGHHFLSYVVPCISGEIKRYFRDHGWMVRPPRPIQELQPRIEREQLRLDPRTGQAPSEAEMARRLDVSIDSLRQALQVRGCFSPASLDAPISADGELLVRDTLVGSAPGHEYDAAEARAMLEPALATLSSTQRWLLQMRFFEGRTQGDIGAQLGVSQSQVSRLLREALRRLRQVLESGAPPNVDTAA